MNIIYLDIDGVLTNKKDDCMLFICKPENYKLSRDNVNNMQEILKKCDVKIILSTSWRNYPRSHIFENNKGWQYHGLLDDVYSLFGKYIIGKAPHMDGSNKVNDIVESILSIVKENDIDKIAILDDDPSQGLDWINERGPEWIRWFRTTQVYGLDSSIKNRIIYYFNN